MKPLEISRAQTGTVGIGTGAPLTLPRVSQEKARALDPSQLDAPVAAGLSHVAPTVADQAGPPQSGALDVLASQTPPHRRGRTAALRVKDVKAEGDAATKRAFKPLVELSGTLQEALAPFGIKR